MTNNFDDFLSQQCRPISNDSILPLITRCYTNNNLSSRYFNNDKILKIIQFLDLSKLQINDGI